MRQRADQTRGNAFLAAFAAIGAVVVALQQSQLFSPPDVQAPCDGFVEVRDGGLLKGACMSDQTFVGCGAVQAGDAVVLGASGCTRLPQDMSAPVRLTYGYPLDLNRASAEDLALLPEVSDALAAAIVAYRTANGPFVSVDGLDNVPGIGPTGLQKLRTRLFIGLSPNVR